ncbi:hypothetical protein INS49_003199 [Diaporthe citri]|uniref:uncharacterized protein n=1 Tax=Diaporthe citri TaxID=83186 RepID=UPI001C800ABF|nr:uncharacterized protein INS49_003199 [Diaporthe citri]KAG6368980.1 hypothetical protein INS49_003199 [Diaporthe citri]
MFTLSSNISPRASGVVRTSSGCGRLPFSTGHALRYGGGPLFNLGGLGASREAQYLSKERGIPRTEYSANIHLIRSSEVDPFAPAPGSTRTAAARAAARAQAEAHSQLASAAVPNGRAAPDPAAHGGLAAMAAQLQALRDELAETKRVLRGVQARRERPGNSMASHLLSTAIILTLMFFIGKDVSQRVTGPSKPADSLIEAHPLADAVDEATAQRQRDAPVEEQALAESGLTSFEGEPAVLGNYPRRSVLSGLFWART